MFIITLPDSSQRSYPSPISVYDVAADIGPGLASDALAGKVDGMLFDLSHVIESDAELSIVTSKSEETKQKRYPYHQVAPQVLFEV